MLLIGQSICRNAHGGESRAARERGYLVRQLSGDDRQLLAELSRSLKPHYWDPTLASEIHTTKALMELSLLFLDECGFSSATNFCRAFKSTAGTTPGTWRNEIYVQYQQPRAKLGADYKQHGRRRAVL